MTALGSVSRQGSRMSRGKKGAFGDGADVSPCHPGAMLCHSALCESDPTSTRKCESRRVSAPVRRKSYSEGSSGKEEHGCISRSWRRGVVYEPMASELRILARVIDDDRHKASSSYVGE